MMLRFRENGFDTAGAASVERHGGEHEREGEVLELPADILERRNHARGIEAQAAISGLNADNQIEGNVYLAENFANGFALMTEAAARGAAKGRAVRA